ncbi:MAG TPA: acyl-CoA dehydrogenase [Usitatibacter sp.]|nr:acyl-CoA dehydrogenase [Usitatibacter sp.]
MNFDLTEEQQLLAESVRRFVAQDYGFEARKRILASDEGWSPQAWRTIAELGLTALPLPTEHGGFGGGAVDLMAVMEAFGEALVVEPYLATLTCSRLVARAGSAEQQAAILPRVADGQAKLAFAYLEDGARYDLRHVNVRATPQDGRWSLRGTKRVVLHAPMADRLVVSARGPRGTALFLVDRPGAVNAYRTVDGMRAADVMLDGTPAELLGGEDDALPAIEDAIDFATALVCAEAVGAMRSANAATLEYLKTRKQFGVPIGAFQALQHRMVDMVITLEQARSMASLACTEVDGHGQAASRRRIVSAAKIKIADACRHISQESVQLHGGMGMTDELKVSHTFRRLTMIAQQFGDADHHLERFASA